MSIGNVKPSFSEDNVFANTDKFEDRREIVSEDSDVFKKIKKIFTKEKPKVWEKQEAFDKMLKLGVSLYGENVHNYGEDTTTNWKGVRQIFRYTKTDGISARRVRYFDKDTGLFYTVEFPLEGSKTEIRPMDSAERQEFISTVSQFKDLYGQFLAEGVLKVFPQLNQKSLVRLEETLELMSKGNEIAQVKKSQPVESEWWRKFQDHSPKVVFFLAGIRDYINNPPNLNDLAAADVDMQRIQRAISTKYPRLYQGAETTILLNNEATKQNIENFFANYSRTLGPLDLFVNVLSGHGASDSTLGIKEYEPEKQSSYFVPADAEGGENPEQYIRDEDYLNMIKSMAQDAEKPPRVFSVWDSCDSGGISIKSPTSPSFIDKNYYVPGSPEIIYTGPDIAEKAKKILGGSSVQDSAAPKDKKMGEVRLNKEEKAVLDAYGLSLDCDYASGHTLAIIFSIIGAHGYKSADPDSDGIITAESLFEAVRANQLKILSSHPEIPMWQYLGKERGYPEPQIGDYYKTSPEHPEELIIGADYSPEEISQIQEDRNNWEIIKREIDKKYENGN